MGSKTDIEKLKEILAEQEAEIVRLMREQDPYNGKYENKFINHKKTADINDCDEIIKNCKIYITKLEIKNKIENQ